MYLLLFNMVGIGQFFTISFDEKKECPSAFFFTVIYQIVFFQLIDTTDCHNFRTFAYPTQKTASLIFS